MHGLITQVFEGLRLGENRRADCLPEAGLVDERAQVVLIGQCEGAVVLVESRHGQLRRASGVEARCPRIGIDQPSALVAASWCSGHSALMKVKLLIC